MEELIQNNENIDDYVNYSPAKESLFVHPWLKWIRFFAMWLVLMIGVLFQLADFNEFYINILSIIFWSVTLPVNNLKFNSENFIVIFGLSAILGVSMLINFHDSQGFIFIIFPILDALKLFRGKKVKYQSER